ncbi:MAG: ABC transporter ATP-binding protein [Gammaproteobacteria bacterium]|nr:MAG: ABC transporter ATP-binding protein [Gammaproteobacteria bacterium]
MGPGLYRRLRGSRPWRVSPPRLAGRRRPWPHGSVARAAHAPAVHGCHGDDRSGLETTPGRRPVRGDVVLYRRLLQETRPYWLHLAGLFGLGLLASPVALLTPVPLKIAVDSVLGGHPLPVLLQPFFPESAAQSPTAILLFAIGLLVAVAALGQLQGLASTLLQAYIGERLVLDFRARLVNQVQRLSVSYHDSRGTADSLYRIQHDVPAIQNLVDGVIPSVSAAITLAMMIIVTVLLDWQLALVALAICPPLFFLSGVYRPRMRSQWRHAKKLESSALAAVQETLGALRVVKAFRQEARETDRFLRRSREGMAARLGLALLQGRYGLYVGLTMALGTAAVLLIGVRHVRTGALTLGQLLLVMGYLAQLYQPLKTISRKAASLQSYLASAERAFALLDERPDVPERLHARPLVRAAGAVEFQHVSFAYNSDRQVLHDVSFAVPAGARVAIVGTTGAGKTTLLGLLTRFYDPTAGAILLDGMDLRDYRLADLRDQFAIVLQEPVLFSTSIGENIAYGRPGASDLDIVRAAKAAGAHDFIASLPRGYATPVGERGIQLSGGERQRVALARAFLKDAPLLILDEPTSSVDVKTEAVILEAMDRLMQGRTAFLITHRLSALATCDARLQLEQGRLVETAPTLAYQVR